MRTRAGAERNVLTAVERRTNAHSGGHGECTSTEDAKNSDALVEDGADADGMCDTAHREKNGGADGLEQVELLAHLVMRVSGAGAVRAGKGHTSAFHSVSKKATAVTINSIGMRMRRMW